MGYPSEKGKAGMGSYPQIRHHDDDGFRTEDVTNTEGTDFKEMSEEIEKASSPNKFYAEKELPHLLGQAPLLEATLHQGA
mmetsp:Transcript_25014/g.29504  ORF Transcript_25014/g.29504 Transcript_25014/m.29504 type:complete len:80 (+) Transcript_25014:83-322(+)